MLANNGVVKTLVKTVEGTVLETKQLTLVVALGAMMTACGGGSGSSGESVQVAQQPANTIADDTIATDSALSTQSVSLIDSSLVADTAASNQPTESDTPEEANTETSKENTQTTTFSTPTISARTLVSSSALGNCSDFQDKDAILASLNAARAKARYCVKKDNQGNVVKKIWYKAAPALAWNSKLTEAALNHANYMAETGDFSHTQNVAGMENIDDRIAATGYAWKAAGENIAKGNVSYDAVLNGWLESFGHCENIMAAHYEDFGSACMIDSSGNGSAVWAQAFGTE